MIGSDARLDFRISVYLPRGPGAVGRCSLRIPPSVHFGLLYFLSITQNTVARRQRYALILDEYQNFGAEPPPLLAVVTPDMCPFFGSL